MRWTSTLVFLALLILSPPAQAQEETQEPEASDFVIGLSAFNMQVISALEQQPTRRVIVLPFTDMQGMRNRVTLYITEQLITAIAATHGYQLLDSGHLAELAEKEGLSPFDLAISPAYKQVASQVANTSVVVGVVTFLQTRAGVMARVIRGESGQISGGAQVYLKAAGEIRALLGRDIPPELEEQQVETPEAVTTADSQEPMEEKTETRELPADAEAETAVETRATVTREDTGQPVSLEGRNEQSLYNEGRERYESGQYDSAIMLFDHLVESYPDSPLADNSIYWSGECHYSKKRWQEALNYFNRVLTAYPFGNKVPASMLKTSYAHEKLGQAAQAVAALEQLIQRFPDSEEADAARRRLQILRATQQR